MSVEAKASRARAELGFVWIVNSLALRNDGFILVWKGLPEDKFPECGGQHKIMQQHKLA